MSVTAASPRRTCPACQRRYAGLVANDCPVCQGIGVLSLGAAALAHYEPAAVARAIDLYLENAAHQAINRLPLGERREALEVATDELRIAGVLASTDTLARAPRHTIPDAEAATVTELEAYRVTGELGRPATRAVLSSLAAPQVDDLAPHRPRNGRVPTASLNGHLAAIAVIADPIDPIGPDVAQLAETQRVDTYRARVIAAAVPQAVHKRTTHR